MDSSIMSAEAKKAFFSQDKDERDLYFRRLMALAEGATPEFVQKITGLDSETIKQLAAGSVKTNRE